MVVNSSCFTDVWFDRICVVSLQNRDGGGEAADQLDVHLSLRFPQGQLTQNIMLFHS